MDILSSLEPLGIFSKDLPHCLLRQLEARQELTPELNQIIRYHLDDIAAGKINTITQKLSMSTQDEENSIEKKLHTPVREEWEAEDLIFELQMMQFDGMIDDMRDCVEDIR